MTTVTPTRGPAHWTRMLSGRALVSLLFMALALSMLYPLYITLVTSFKKLPDYQQNKTGLPRSWTLENFKQAWSQAKIGHYALNSAIVVAIGLAILVLVATTGGFAFAHLQFPLRRTILGILVSFSIVSPGLQIVPVFKLAVSLNLLNTYIGLALINVSFSIPFGIYLMSSYFEGLPRSIFEAAMIDGAGIFRTFRLIALPLAMPGLLTLLTLAFLSFWNEFIFALLIILDPSKRTLTVGIARLEGTDYTSQPLLAAGLVLAMIPCVLVFALLQRNLNEGLTAGAVKG